MEHKHQGFETHCYAFVVTVVVDIVVVVVDDTVVVGIIVVCSKDLAHMSLHVDFGSGLA